MPSEAKFEDKNLSRTFSSSKKLVHAVDNVSFTIQDRQVLIANEPTSMVDACSRASILDYLMKLKQELDMTIVFVTHDIGLAYYVSDSIFIMHKGRIVEQGPPDQVTQAPTSEVTKQLL